MFILIIVIIIVIIYIYALTESNGYMQLSLLVLDAFEKSLRPVHHSRDSFFGASLKTTSEVHTLWSLRLAGRSF